MRSLDGLFEAAADRIEEAGGSIETFVGDAVIAVFGAPVAQEDHAERALHAALALRRRTAEIFGDTVALGIGVDTGEVLDRPRPGGRRRRDRRGGHTAPPGWSRPQIRVRSLSASVRFAHARSAFEFGPARLVEAKGFTEGAPCRPLRRALATDPGAARRVFVGRRRELELLRAAYRRVAEESRRTRHRRRRRGRRQDARSSESFGTGSPSSRRSRCAAPGSCLAYGRATTYRPLADVLRGAARPARDRPVRGDRACPARRTAILGLVLGLDVAGRSSTRSSRAKRLHDRLVEFLTGSPRRGPSSSSLEDLHWAQEPLLDLVERVLLRGARAAARGRSPRAPSCSRSPAPRGEPRPRRRRRSGSTRSRTARRTELLLADLRRRRRPGAPPSCSSSGRRETLLPRGDPCDLAEHGPRRSPSRCPRFPTRCTPCSRPDRPLAADREGALQAAAVIGRRVLAWRAARAAGGSDAGLRALEAATSSAGVRPRHWRVSVSSPSSTRSRGRSRTRQS